MTSFQIRNPYTNTMNPANNINPGVFIGQKENCKTVNPKYKEKLDAVIR